MGSEESGTKWKKRIGREMERKEGRRIRDGRNRRGCMVQLEGQRKEQGQEAGGGKEEQRKCEGIFWNVAGAEGKDRNFWDYVVGKDFIGW